MNEFNLTAQEPPAPLPRATRLTDWESLVGHTLLAVIGEPNGKFVCDVLIVTETHCWAALEAAGDGCDDASVRIIGSGYEYGHASGMTMDAFASPPQLLRAGVISEGECTRLEAIRDDEKKQRDARRVQSLRAELARLEGGCP